MIAMKKKSLRKSILRLRPTKIELPSLVILLYSEVVRKANYLKLKLQLEQVFHFTIISRKFQRLQRKENQEERAILNKTHTIILNKNEIQAKLPLYLRNVNKTNRMISIFYLAGTNSVHHFEKTGENHIKDSFDDRGIQQNLLVKIG